MWHNGTSTDCKHDKLWVRFSFDIMKLLILLFLCFGIDLENILFSRVGIKNAKVVFKIALKEILKQ